MKRQFYRVLTLLLVLCLTLSAVVSCAGGGGEPQLSVKSANVSLNQKEMRYFLYVETAGILGSQYDYFYANSQNAAYADKNAYVFEKLPQMIHTKENLRVALEFAKQVVLYGEAARAEGLTLDGEDTKLVDKGIADLEATAKSMDMTTKAFLSAYVGRNMTLEDVRSALEKEALARKYASSLRETLSKDVTADEAREYLGSHRELFFKTHYIGYSTTNARWKSDLTECSDVEHLKLTLAYLVLDDRFMGQYVKVVRDAGIVDPNGMDHTCELVWETLCAMLEFKNEEGIAYEPRFTANETDPYAKAGYEIAQNMKALVEEEFKQIRPSVASYVDINDEDIRNHASDLDKWLFSPGRMVGDSHVLMTTTTYTDGSSNPAITQSTYTWALVTQSMVLDEATWEGQAVDGVVTERLSEWLDEAMKTYAYNESYNDSEWKPLVSDDSLSLGDSFVYESNKLTNMGGIKINVGGTTMFFSFSAIDLSKPLPEADTQG